MTDRNYTCDKTTKQSATRPRRRQKVNTRTFIQRSILRHGLKYDYSESVYITGLTKAKITCNDCGASFLQNPSCHMKGKGCAHCAGCKRLTTKQFINKAKLLHQHDRFDYSKVKYHSSHSKVVIVCELHGEFSIKPNSMLDSRSKGCAECGRETQGPPVVAFDSFVSRARVHHGFKYKYYRADYTLSTIKVKIHCDVHGDFWQVGTDHINGHGCKCCGLDMNGFGRSNFSAICNKRNSGQGSLYVVKCRKDNEVFIKVGITSQSIKQRLNKKFPYDYDVLFHIKGDGGYIYDLETKLHGLLKSNRYQPKIEFGGHTECFTTIKPIEKILKELSSTDQLQLLA